MIKTENVRQAINALRDCDPSEVRHNLVTLIRQVPKTPENLDLFKTGYSLIGKIPDPMERAHTTIDFVREIPASEAFMQVYKNGMEDCIVAADSLDEAHKRTTELLRIASSMPATAEFMDHRVHAWRLALNLPDKPLFREVPIQKIARELPKSLDYAFYRRYTILGIAKEMPRDGLLLNVYREAIKVAIAATAYIEEPFYKKYALMYIAGDLPKTEDLFDLYKEALSTAYKVSLDIKDPFAREHSVLDILPQVPKTPEFFTLLREMLQHSIEFFTVKKWIDDVDVYDVVDYILSAEETGINESKKKRFNREKYARVLSSEIEKFGADLNDTRYIEVLRPYTHVWVQPKGLRDSVKKVVERLESLKGIFHGKEIERPVFLKEVHTGGVENYIHKKEASAADCVSIDLGATNTVIMRKKGDAAPDFIVLAPISKKYGKTCVVPTVLSAETNSIGAEVTGEDPIVNIKQLLLEGNPKGRLYMERFFRILYQALKKSLSANTGWFSRISKDFTEVIYITVPVGYQEYRDSMKEIASKVIKGVRVEFIEEPLAAAVGYQVVEDRDKLVMIIDFGGSTLNTMVLRLNLKEVHIVAKPDRAQLLGGYDIDTWLAEHLAGKIGLPREEIRYRLVSEAERLKIELSSRREAAFEWDGREVCKLSRQEFEEMLEEREFYKFIDRAVTNVLRKAEKVGFRKERIEAVLLTGGSSQIPSFKDKIGHIFPELRNKNLIFDHSPLSAVGLGAALYGTKDITDRHLGMAYAVRFATQDKDNPHSYHIVLEKGETLPLEKTYRVSPARKLGLQNEIFLELFEVPDSLISRRWVTEAGIEFLKQEMDSSRDVALNSVKSVTLPFKEAIENDSVITFKVGASGGLEVVYGEDMSPIDTGIKLQ